MNRMQFGDYVFLHNPRQIELSCADSLAMHPLPGLGAAAQNLGPRCRVVRCEGELFAASADGAAESCAALAAACTAGVSALLYLPTGEHFEAYCSRFAYTARGDGRVYTYALEFLARTAQRCAT